MKNAFIKSTIVGLLVIAIPLAVGAAKADAQQNADDSPNELSGDGVRNVLQDEEFGEYGEGEGESPNDLAGDGVPNASQDEDFGAYGGENAPKGPDGEVMDGIGQGLQTGTPGNQQGVQAQNAGEVSQLQARAHTVSELNEYMVQKRKEIRREVAAANGTVAAIRGEREGAELAVKAMMAAGPMLGEEQATQRMYELAAMVGEANEDALKAETKTRERSAVARFFAGGDDSSAEDLESALKRSRAAVQEMNQLVEDCDTCDEAAREVLREQIRAIESEQNRTEGVAEMERASKGLFGFLFGWLS